MRYACRPSTQPGRSRQELSPTAGMPSVSSLPARTATAWITWCATATKSGSAPTSLGEVGMDRCRGRYRDAREIVDEAAVARSAARLHVYLRPAGRASIWLVSLALLVYLAHRISRPIQQLTAGLPQLAAGDLNTRVEARRDDEIGRAIGAFNDMAEQLQESTERLVYLHAAGQLADAGAQDGARSEELAHAHPPHRGRDAGALRRCRPRLHGAGHADRGGRDRDPGAARPRLLAIRRRAAGAARRRSMSMRCCRSASRSSRPAIPRWPTTAASTARRRPCVADQDLIKGILTNLLENAAEAAGEGGRILGVTAAENGRVAIEVHDSGPGLSEQARPVAVSAHHFVQEARHGPGAFHRAQERAAVRRRHCTGERRTGRRRFPRAAAHGNQWHPNAS